MSEPFARIGLFAKYNSLDVKETFMRVIDVLKRRGHQLLVEQLSAQKFELSGVELKPAEAIGAACDLVIVVGGDGSLLKAARAVIDAETPVLGVNRGRLGFLADIHPDQLEARLTPVLEGKYVAESRSLLQIDIIRDGIPCQTFKALNDLVLYNSDIARMIEFEVYIDDQFVLYQRADGLIAATPTGSTAYALSGGGPILYPTLDAFLLLPMFPHTLTTRPIVVNENSTIRLTITPNTDAQVESKISVDGQEHFTLLPDDHIAIRKHPNMLRLLHPVGYNYFAVLREKLGWNSQVSSDRYLKSE